MTEKRTHRPASEQEISLYCHIGEAVCTVQHVEDALSHSIVLKGFTPLSRIEADQYLEKHRKYTLGNAIGIASDKAVYSQPILIWLRGFLKERNWLIHNSVAQGSEALKTPENMDLFIDRIRGITKQAHDLLQIIEEDLIDFAEENGKDMSRVKAEIRRHYNREDIIRPSKW